MVNDTSLVERDSLSCVARTLPLMNLFGTGRSRCSSLPECGRAFLLGVSEVDGGRFGELGDFSPGSVGEGG